MLTESDTGTLKPVGPTADMSQVQTSDMPLLVLADYLADLGENTYLQRVYTCLCAWFVNYILVGRGGDHAESYNFCPRSINGSLG